jgi:uncharacterized protein with GYD domain
MSKEEGRMDTFIILGNWTAQGMARMKETPARIEATRQEIAAAGGKMIAWYLTMGRYDFVVITEAPNAATAAAMLLATGMRGNISTETLRAFTEGEFKGIVSQMP